MPTISDLKDQARAFEQQGQIGRALAIYQHILKHVEGTPALAKVLPLYVKVGDLLTKLDRPSDAIESYEAAAEQYAQVGAAPRVVALCGRILRLAPDRSDTYTKFAHRLIEHDHVGPAREVLFDYAEHAGLDQIVQELNGLEGHPDGEALPVLERLLDLFEQDEEQEQTARRVSSHLEQVPDKFEAELPDESSDENEKKDTDPPAATEPPQPTGMGFGQQNGAESLNVPEEGAADEFEPMTPHMLDLDHMPQRTSFMGSASELGVDAESETADEEEEPFSKPDEGDLDLLREFASDVTPTAEAPTWAPTGLGGEADMDTKDEASAESPVEFLDVDASEDEPKQEDEFQFVPVDEEPLEPTTADAPESSEAALESVTADPTPEEPVAVSEDIERDERAETSAEELGVRTETTEEPEAKTASTDEPEGNETRRPTPRPFQPVRTPEHVPPSRRSTRAPRIALPPQVESKPKSRILFAVIGFVIGVICGATAMYFLLPDGPGGAPPEIQSPVTGAVADPQAQTADPQTEVTSQPAIPEDSTAESQSTAQPTAPIELATDTPEVTPPAEQEAPQEADAEVTQTPADTSGGLEQPEDDTAGRDSPIVVEGLATDNVTPAIHPDGVRTGYRVVHSLTWSTSPLVIESYRDTTITRISQVTVNVTSPDTVVGILRLEGYMVYASGVMPEDSLRSLMSRLVEGEREN